MTMRKMKLKAIKMRTTRLAKNESDGENDVEYIKVQKKKKKKAVVEPPNKKVVKEKKKKTQKDINLI